MIIQIYPIYFDLIQAEINLRKYMSKQVKKITNIYEDWQIRGKLFI